MEGAATLPPHRSAAEVRQVAFVLTYAAANGAALTLAGAATCGLQLEWYVGIGLLALVLASLQSVVVRSLGVPAVLWLPFTLIGVVAAAPFGFSAVYLLAVILLGGSSLLGLSEQLAGVATLLVLTLPVALAGVIIAAAQLPALPRPREPYVVLWFASNAAAGFIGAPALENIGFRCYPTGITPVWFEATPIGWIVTGLVAGALTGTVLWRARRVSAVSVAS